MSFLSKLFRGNDQRSQPSTPTAPADERSTTLAEPPAGTAVEEPETDEAQVPPEAEQPADERPWWEAVPEEVQPQGSEEAPPQQAPATQALEPGTAAVTAEPEVAHPVDTSAGRNTVENDGTRELT